jgi:hypothetical protein
LLLLLQAVASKAPAPITADSCTNRCCFMSKSPLVYTCCQAGRV